MPSSSSWLSKAYIGRYDQVLNCKVDSWDIAFDRPFPKGSHLNAIKKKRVLEFQVFNEVRDIFAQSPDTPTDKNLFEDVGKKLGLGATLTEEYYYSVLKRLPMSKSR